MSPLQSHSLKLTVCCFSTFFNVTVTASYLLESKYGVETKSIAADFSATDIYPKIEAGLTGLEVGVLGK